MSACVRCRRHRRHHAHGECDSCYYQRYAPRTGNPGGAGIPKTRADIAGRVEGLAELLRHETDRTMIANRLGVSVRTVSRYLDRLERSA